MNAYCLENGTHRTTGLYTGTGSCGFHEYAGTAKLGFLLVGDSLLAQRDLDQILLSIFDTLRNSCRYLVGFSKAIAYDTVFIADNDDGCKAEVTTTLGDLGHSLNRYQSVFKFQIDGFNLFSIDICHSA